MAIRVRKAVLQDADGIAHVQIDTWRSTYAGIVPHEHLANLSFERGRRNWERILLDMKGTILVAEDHPSHVLGFVNCGPARDSKEFVGEIYAIYVVQNMQGKGVGQVLFLSAADDLVARGFDSMLVWVLAENPYRRFYEKLGGKPTLSKETVVGGKVLKEIGYGWKDLYSLVGKFKGRN